MCRLSLFSFVVVLLVAHKGASAVETVEIVSQITSSPPVVRNDLYIDFDFYLAEQHLTVELTAGSIVYDTCPQCDPSHASFWTSVFLGGPDDPNAVIFFPVMTSTEFEVTWSPTPPLSIQNQDDFHVARVFLSTEAQGSWTYKGEEIALAALIPAAPTIRGTISAGVMAVVPEPSTFGLLALAIGVMAGCRSAKSTVPL
jgi:hypothetical protein